MSGDRAVWATPAAQTALLRYHGRLPHKQSELFDWQFDHPVSPGTIYNMTERVAAGLRPAYEEVLDDELAEDITLCCDGWSAYPSYHRKLQRCWAHLLREAKYVAERHEEAEPISDVLHPTRI